MKLTSRAGLVPLLVALAATAAGAYWNYDPGAIPTGGPHRKINECAWDLFLTLKLREAETPDPILERYQFKNSDLPMLAGETVTSPGAWTSDITTGPASFTIIGWSIEGGYTADEPELFASLRHFYDPTAAEGRRYLTDIPWIAQFRESMRSYWRRDVEFENPTIDARDWALNRSDNRYSLQRSIAFLRHSVGPGDHGAKEREEAAAAAWRGLGETMHLLADMTVPSHVRNDGHPGKLPAGELRPDPYEAWILAPEVEAAWRSIPRTGPLSKLDPGAAIDPRAMSGMVSAGSPMALFHNVASYTNRHFFSSDTISGKRRDGTNVSPMTGKAYPSPRLESLTWDDGGGTYVTDIPNRGTVLMTKETWESNSWSSLMTTFGLTVAGGQLHFDTSSDCARSQARALVPIAIYANHRMIDWYLPRFVIEINDIELTGEKRIRATITHKPYGVFTQPLKVTLPEAMLTSINTVQIDDVPQLPKDFELKVEAGKVTGTLHGIDFTDASQVNLELELAGIRVRSLDYTLGGQVFGRVCKKEDEVEKNPNNPMATLGGDPLEDKEVVVTWIQGGKGRKVVVRTNKEGQYRVNVPLNVEITVAVEGYGGPQVRCTADKPRQVVDFGWQGHKVVVDKVGREDYRAETETDATGVKEAD